MPENSIAAHSELAFICTHTSICQTSRKWIFVRFHVMTHVYRVVLEKMRYKSRATSGSVRGEAGFMYVRTEKQSFDRVLKILSPDIKPINSSRH